MSLVRYRLQGLPQEKVHGVDRGGPAAAARPRSARCPANLARVLHVRTQRAPQLVTVLGVEVDLVLGAVEGKADGAFSRATVDVVNEQRLDLLGHAAYPTCRPRDCKAA